MFHLFANPLQCIDSYLALLPWREFELNLIKRAKGIYLS